MDCYRILAATLIGWIAWFAGAQGSEYDFTNANTRHLRGVGTDEPSDVYQRWLRVYSDLRLETHGVTVETTYQVTNSDLGLCLITGQCSSSQPMTFAGCNSVLHDDIEEADLEQIPTMSWSLAIAYNLPHVDKLYLSSSSLSGIFRKTITQWNHRTLVADNPLLRFFGALPIQFVVDASHPLVSAGTEALILKTIEWPKNTTRDHHQADDTSLGKLQFSVLKDRTVLEQLELSLLHARTTDIGIQTLKENRGSLSFLMYNNIKRYNLSAAWLLDSKGQWHQPTANGRAKPNRDMHTHEAIYNEHLNAVSGYPEQYLTYHALHDVVPSDISCVDAAEYFRFFEWFSTSDEAAAIAREYGYRMLALKSYEQVLAGHILEHVTCNGEKLYALHKSILTQETLEKESYEFRKNIAIIVSGILATLVTCYSVYRYRRSKRRDSSAERFRIDSFRLAVQRDSDVDEDEPLVHLNARLEGNNVILSKLFCKLNPLDYNSETEKANFIFLRELSHVNLAAIAGFLTTDGTPMLVMSGETQRTLHDVLEHAGKYLDTTTRTGITKQIFEAVNYLHRYKIIHGLVCPDVCMIDANYTVKVSDWIQFSFLKAENEEVEFVNKLCSLHETVMSELKLVAGSVATDVKTTELPELKRTIFRLYYFLDQDVLNSKSVAYGHDLYSLGVTTTVMFVNVSFQTLLMDRFIEEVEPAGIFAHTMSMPPPLARFALACIEKALCSRPTAATMIQSLMKQGVFTSRSIVDDLLTKLETYAKQLEDKIEKGIQTVKTVNDRMDQLLSNMLPPSVARQLSRGLSVPPTHFSSASVMFTQVTEFEEICALSTPVQIIRLLNDLFDMFDTTTDMYDVYKVETTADVYMTTSGIPIQNGNDHAAQLAALACHLIDIAQSVSIEGLPPVVIKAGLATGPVMAGILGLKTPRYCLFGNTVNVAARMETLSEPRRLQATATAADLLRNDTQFVVLKRGSLPVKGKGVMTTYWIRRSVGGQFTPKLVTPLNESTESKDSGAAVDIDI